MRKPNSGRFVLAKGIAPASFIRSTTGASWDGIASAIAGTPWVVGEPTQSIFSLMVKGTPCSGPDAGEASAWSAASSAESASTRVTAFTAGLTTSIRLRCDSTTSRLETSFLRISSASSVALCRHSSLDIQFPINETQLSGAKLRNHPNALFCIYKIKPTASAVSKIAIS